MTLFFVRFARRQLAVRTLAVGALAAGVAPTSSAQMSVDVGVVAGYYRPVGHFRPASVFLTSLPTTPSDLSAPMFGAEATLHFTTRFGLQAQGNVTSSSVGVVATPEGSRGPTSATIMVGSAQVLYDVLPDRAHRLWISAGPGVVRHGGDAYSSFGSPTQLAAAVGIGSTVTLFRHLQATAGLSALFYSFDLPALGLDPRSLEGGPQQDLLVHVGIAWSSR
jgi:hypothetical protein